MSVIVAAEKGTVTTTTSTTLIDSSKIWGADTWLGCTIIITSGTGKGQSREITGNTSNTLTVTPAWTVNPRPGDEYTCESADSVRIWDGTTRAVVQANGADAISNTAINALRALTFALGLAPDGAFDRLRTVDNAAPLLGYLAASPARQGASDIIGAYSRVISTESTRVTLATPTAGTTAQVVFAFINLIVTESTEAEMYFGTQTNLAGDTSKVILAGLPGATTGGGNIFALQGTWPDGAGPVGAEDDVISIRVGGLLNYSAYVFYREA